MSRAQSVVVVLIGTLVLGAFAYLAPTSAPVTAYAADPSNEDVSWLPEGLELKDPEMAYGLEGVMRDLNVELSKDVRPVDNAAVLLVQVFGEETFASELRGASMDMLGIRKLAPEPRFQYIPQYAQGHRDPSITLDEQLDRMAESVMRCTEQVWTSDEFPELAAYLDTNSEALDLVVIASDRPKYYAPLLSLEDPMRLMAASFSVEFRMPFMARCLTARALNRFANGEIDAALEDLMACHKLGVLLAKGSPLDISCAKAHMVDAFAGHAELTMVRSGQLSPEHASQILAALKAAPEMPKSDDAADRGERALLHEELELLRSDEESRKGYFESGSAEDLQALENIVKKPSLYRLMIDAADALQDKMVRALGKESHAELAAELRVLDAEFAAWHLGEQQAPVPFAEFAAADPEAAARSIGHSMAMALRTNGWQRRHTDDRAQHRRDVAHIGLALIIYRGEHGAFPEELSALAPELLDHVPLDVFSDEPWMYDRRSPEHAVLISYGANQTNDHGALLNDDVIVELR